MAVLGPTVGGDNGGSCSGTDSSVALPWVCATTGGVTTDGLLVNKARLSASEWRERFGESFRVFFFFLWEVLAVVGGIASLLLLLSCFLGVASKVDWGPQLLEDRDPGALEAPKIVCA